MKLNYENKSVSDKSKIIVKKVSKIPYIDDLIGYVTIMHIIPIPHIKALTNGHFLPNLCS